eukprot:XP_025001608.1 pulmonary surfactant-associated protein A [Gallus gallus]
MGPKGGVPGPRWGAAGLGQEVEADRKRHHRERPETGSAGGTGSDGGGSGRGSAGSRGRAEVRGEWALGPRPLLPPGAVPGSPAHGCGLRGRMELRGHILPPGTHSPAGPPPGRLQELRERQRGLRQALGLRLRELRRLCLQEASRF